MDEWVADESNRQVASVFDGSEAALHVVSELGEVKEVAGVPRYAIPLEGEIECGGWLEIGKILIDSRGVAFSSRLLHQPLIE